MARRRKNRYRIVAKKSHFLLGETKDFKYFKSKNKALMWGYKQDTYDDLTLQFHSNGRWRKASM